MQIYAGFRVLEVKFNKKYNVLHQLFLKQHKVRGVDEDRPSELTLFVCNVPPYCTEDTFKSLFSHCGMVKSVFFSSPEAPTLIFHPQDGIFSGPECKGYKIAYVVFSSVQGLENALKWDPEEHIVLSSENCPIETGYKKWYKKFAAISNIEGIQQEVNEYMKAYDENANAVAHIEKMAAEPDEEGWVTVTKRGRRPGFSRKRNTRPEGQKLRKKRNKKELLNFYTFQIKESKMKHISQLREKFALDKKKIEEMKLRRKFKPF